MHDEGTCPRRVSSLMIPCVFRSSGSQLVHLWEQRSCRLSSSHNCRPSTVFSANCMEGCRTREANQRACTGTGRVVTAESLLFACEPLSCFHLFLPKTKALPCASDDHPCRGRSVCLGKHERPNLLRGSYCVICTGHVRSGLLFKFCA